jgi:hypothetical protein
MINMPVGSLSSQTSSHPIDMNNNNNRRRTPQIESVSEHGAEDVRGIK